MASNKNKKVVVKRDDSPDVSLGVKQVGSSITNYNPAFRLGTLEGPDRTYYERYEYAFRTEPVINRALRFICATMLASIGGYIHPDRKIQSFVRDNLDNADGNVHEWMESLILSALIYGRGNSEILWQAKGDQIWLKDLANYHPRSIHLVVDAAGRLTNGKSSTFHPFLKKTGVWQELPTELVNYGRPGRDKWMNYLRINLNKMVLVTHNKRFGNYDGESCMAPIWLHYQMKTKTLQDLMITTERYGSPQIAAIVPNGLTSNIMSDPSNPTGTRYETIAEAAARNLANMSISTALVFEEPTGLPGEKIRIQPINTGNNFGDSFLSTIHKLNHEMLLGLGLPPLLFLEQSVGLGSGNISATQAESYKQTMVAMYKEFIEPFTEQVIGRLVRYNFGDDITNVGRFEFNPFDIAAAGVLATVIDKAIDCGLIDSSEEEDLQLGRARLGFPVINDTKSLDRRLKANKELMYTRRNNEQVKTDGAMKIADRQAENELKTQEKQLEFDRETREQDFELKREEKKLDLQHQKETEKLKAQTAIKVAKAKPKPKPPAKKQKLSDSTRYKRTL